MVLGIPRGGVVTADIVAKKLSAPYFDILIPRKLTDPENKEQAIGAIMEDGTTYIDEELSNQLYISQEYVEKEKINQIEEIKRRNSLYRKSALEYNFEERTVILVDDGAATGATVIVAARWIRKQKRCRLLIALPVAPKDTVRRLKEECDTVEVVTSPSAYFLAVGKYYRDFGAVSDEQVIDIMNKRNLR
jgi:putative phosphoribosyl transferase